MVVVYTKVGRQIVPQSGASAGESSTAETFLARLEEARLKKRCLPLRSPSTGLWSQQPLVEKLPVQCHPAHKLYSAACTCLTNKFGNGLHVIPGFHTPCSIVDVSLRRMQHCCGWHQLCHKGGKIMWTLHNHIIVFAHKLPPDNLLCTSTNTVDDTFFMG